MVNRQAEIQKQQDLYLQQWRELRNKLDSILVSGKIMTSDEARKICSSLDGMTPEDRIKTIGDKWGTLYLDRCKPILHQLQTLEKVIAK